MKLMICLAVRTCSAWCILLAVAALLASGCVSYRRDYTGVAPSICEVHHCKMQKTVVPVRHEGLVPVRARDIAMTEARPAAFPHAEDSVNMGPMVDHTQEAVIYTCPDCERARRAWEADYDGKH